MSYLSSWLIGSVAGLPSFDFVIDGVPVSTAAGDYYLYDAIKPDLTDVMEAAMDDAGVPAVSAVFLVDSGKIRLNAGGVFDVSWGTASTLRDLLGFTGDLAGADGYTAPNKSPLMWTPGKPETPVGHRLGVVGHRVPTVYQAVSPYSGKAESVSHGSRTFARYLWPMVDSELVVATGNPGGTFARFFDEVAVKSARWKLYREVEEDPNGNSSVLASLNQPVGPYVFSNTRNGPTWQYDTSKGFERTDRRADIEVRCHSVEEYS